MTWGWTPCQAGLRQQEKEDKRTHSLIVREPTPDKNPGAKRDDFSKDNTVQSHRQHRAKIFKFMRLDTDSVSTTPVAEKFSMWLTWVKFCFAAGL